jgi:glutamine synthetase
MKTIVFPENTKNILAEYIWIDAFNTLRSKTKVIPFDENLKNLSIDQLPLWNYDGSSTGQADGSFSEVNLKPVNIYSDPFRECGILVLCETYDINMEPLETNYRHRAEKVFNSVLDHHPWFGLEQEYVIYDNKTNLPFNWRYIREKQGKYYCGIGGNSVFSRQFVEEHLQLCLSIGLQMSGINAEVMPSQWEFQVGPVEGIEACDQLWIAKYILMRLSEKYEIYINFNAKPMRGDWNGSGCHVNYSTEKTRNEGGMAVIEEMISKLERFHMEHIKEYGNNDQRLTGLHETSRIDQFSYGVADRSASIRIPTSTKQNGCGYFEDRRPASDIDPYRALTRLVETTLL